MTSCSADFCVSGERLFCICTQDELFEKRLLESCCGKRKFPFLLRKHKTNFYTLFLKF